MTTITENLKAFSFEQGVDLVGVASVGALNGEKVVDKALCRPVLLEQLPKGTYIESCWACRKSCPVGIKHKKLGVRHDGIEGWVQGESFHIPALKKVLISI